MYDVIKKQKSNEILQMSKKLDYMHEALFMAELQ